MRYPTRFATHALAFAALLLPRPADAGIITYHTDGPGTGFGGTTLALSNSAGTGATLAFVANGNTTTGEPSYLNFGTFTLAWAST